MLQEFHLFSFIVDFCPILTLCGWFFFSLAFNFVRFPMHFNLIDAFNGMNGTVITYGQVRDFYHCVGFLSAVALFHNCTKSCKFFIDKLSYSFGTDRSWKDI